MLSVQCTLHTSHSTLHTLQWMVAHGGIPTEESYGPYLGQDGFCKVDQATMGLKIKVASLHHVTMAPCHHGTMLPWHQAIMGLKIKVASWHHVTMAPCYHGTMLPWHQATMGLNIKGTVP